MGVLEGRGPGSIGRAGNCFENVDTGELLSKTWSEYLLEPVMRVFKGGADGSFAPSISSISSIDGKLWLKSVRLKREDMRGEDEVDDVGEGGPKLDAGIKVCGEGDVELLASGDALLEDGMRGDCRECKDIR